MYRIRFNIGVSSNSVFAEGVIWVVGWGGGVHTKFRVPERI